MSDMFPSIYKKLPIVFCNDIKQIIQQYFNQQWYLIYRNINGKLYDHYFQSDDKEVAILRRNIEKYAFGGAGLDNYILGEQKYPKQKLYQKYIYKKGKQVLQKVVIGQEILKVVAAEIFKRKYEYFMNESLNKFIIMHRRVNLEYGQLNTYDYLVSIGHNIQRGEMRLS
jgi:hypothetical protein